MTTGSPPPAGAPKPAGISITRGTQVNPGRFLLYTEPGVGKTTFLVESPGVAIFDVERGSHTFDTARIGDREADGSMATWSWPRLINMVRALETDEAVKEFSIIGIDTLDAVEQMIFKAIIERDKPKSKGDYDLKDSIEAYGYNKGPTIALNEWTKLLQAIERVQAAWLRRGHIVHFMMLAHAAVARFKNPTGDDFDRYALKIHPTAASYIRGWCDTVLFAQLDMDAKKIQIGNKQRTSKKGTSTGTRFLYTSITAAFDAKTRYSVPPKMPFDAGTFWAAIKAAEVGSPATIRKQIEATLALLADQALVEVAKAEVVKSGENSTRLARILDKLQAKVRLEQEERDAAAEDADEPPPEEAPAEAEIAATPAPEPEPAPAPAPADTPLTPAEIAQIKAAERAEAGQA